MKRFSTVCFAVIFATTLSTAAQANQPASESLQKLMGVWEVEEGINQGIEISEEELEGTTMKGRPPTMSFGILQFEEEDEFEICYALPGAERPKKFESPKGSKIMLFEVEKKD